MALTIYTTLGPDDAYNPGAGWLVNGSANPPQPFVGEAFAFTAAESGYLNRISLAMGAGANLTNGLVHISLSNTGGNIPGTKLESFLNVACSGYFGAANPLSYLNSTARPLLLSGRFVRKRIANGSGLRRAEPYRPILRRV